MRASLSDRVMPRILHFTDIANLRAILRTGALQCHRDAPTDVEVGNIDIKASRRRRQVDCGPGGMLCDYVPFYFAPRSPMMYTIMRGNVEGVSTDLSRLIYFASSTETVYQAGLSCVYTDGNAAVLITKFYDDPDVLGTHVDLPLMQQTMWNSTPEDPDRMRRRMAEFLVHEGLPLELVAGISVYSRQVRDSVVSLADEMGKNVEIAIRRGWYF
jgi:hypothetical protein